MMYVTYLTYLFGLLSLAQCNLRLLKLEEEPLIHYDSIVFAAQWPYGVCNTTQLICKEKASALPKNSMTIHGMWPSLRNGDRLAECAKKDEFIVKPEELHNSTRYHQVWPSLMETNTDEGFWTYEYNKHGHCYVRTNKLPSYVDYFDKVLEVFYMNKYDSLIRRVFPDQKPGRIELPYAELIERINRVFPNQYYKINCNIDKVDPADKKKNVYLLSEMYIYLSLNFTPLASKVPGSNCNQAKPIVIEFQ